MACKHDLEGIVAKHKNTVRIYRTLPSESKFEIEIIRSMGDEKDCQKNVDVDHTARFAYLWSIIKEPTSTSTISVSFTAPHEVL
jgi:hypothetical protein